MLGVFPSQFPGVIPPSPALHLRQDVLDSFKWHFP
jgi:hypothetical protein